MENSENHPTEHTSADALQTPVERTRRLFAHPPGIRAQTLFLDQRSMVVASLLAGHTQDAGGHPPVKR